MLWSVNLRIEMQSCTYKHLWQACILQRGDWLVVHVQVPLMSEIVQAWLYTSDNNMGIFDCDFDAKAFIGGTVTDVEAATHGDDNVSSSSPAPYGDTLVPTSQVDDISAHHIWVGFFLQTWQVSSTKPVAQGLKRCL